MYRNSSVTQKMRMRGESYVVSPSVYIATIDEFPELVKIGSSMYVESRVKQLSCEYGLTFRLHSDYLQDVERAAHMKLSGKLYTGRISEKKKTGVEIFECSVDEAVNTVLNLIKTMNLKPVKTIKYRYERINHGK